MCWVLLAGRRAAGCGLLIWVPLPAAAVRRHLRAGAGCTTPPDDAVLRALLSCSSKRWEASCSRSPTSWVGSRSWMNPAKSGAVSCC